MTYAFEALVPALESEVIADLAAILEHRLAAPRGSLLREASLGLWVRTLFQLGGQLPKPRDYDDAFERSQGRGEAWPDRQTLFHRYGGWGTVTAAGVRLLERGGAGRVPANFGHGKDRPPPGTYVATPDRVVEALIEWREGYGEWPHGPKYFEAARLQKRAARLTNLQAPLWPDRESYLGCFATFEVGLEQAKVQWSLRQASAA